MQEVEGVGYGQESFVEGRGAGEKSRFDQCGSIGALETP